MNTQQLLDAAKAKHQASDYRLAQLVGVGQSTLSNYRQGRTHPDDRIARRLAELAELDPGQVVAWMQVERAKDDEARTLWRSVAERLARSAVAGLVAVVGVSVTPDAGASILDRGVSANSLDTRDTDPALYLMTTVRRTWRSIKRACERVFGRFPAVGFPRAFDLAGA